MLAHPRSRAAIAAIAAIATLAALTLTFGAAACTPAGTPSTAAPARQPRVVLVSLDGFRWDYIDRPGAVRLRELAACGVRAERLVPAFPSKTFPNHYTIATGLPPGEHGIVANAMRDSLLGVFRTSDSLAQRDARWWGGEPIWVTAAHQGLHTASMFWPGSEATIGGWPLDWTSRYDHALPRAVRVRACSTGSRSRPTRRRPSSRCTSPISTTPATAMARIRGRSTAHS